MTLLIIVTLHIPICGMHELLYAHKTIFVNRFVHLIYVCMWRKHFVHSDGP